MDILRCDYFLAFSGGTGIPSWEHSYHFSNPVWFLGWRSMAAFLLLALVTLIVWISGAINKQIQYSCSAML